MTMKSKIFFALGFLLLTQVAHSLTSTQVAELLANDGTSGDIFEEAN